MRLQRFSLISAVLFTALLTGFLYSPLSFGQAAEEGEWIATLRGGADWTAKQTACRKLREKGSAAAVPALAALLKDPAMAHLARFALEAMPCPEAGEALRNALLTASGPLQAGIAGSLGARRDAQATMMLIPLLDSEDGEIAAAASRALGHIGTPEAAQFLAAAVERAPESARPAMQEGLLIAADRLTADKHEALAASLLAALLKSAANASIRMGAFHGLAMLEPDKQTNRVLDALRGEDESLREVAARVVSETQGEEATRQYAEALKDMAPEGRIFLLRALSDRRDVAAHDAVIKCCDDAEKAVKLAALKALSTLGNAGDVARLTGFMESEENDIAAGARATLASIEASGIDTAIVAALPKAKPAVKAQLLALLTERRADQASAEALAALKDKEAVVRTAGLDSLAVLGGVDEVKPVMAAINAAPDASERRVAEKALDSLCARNGEAALPLLQEAIKSSEGEVKLVMVRALSRIGGPRALESLAALLNDSVPEVQDEALRELSDWPTADAAPKLLELARSDQENRHVLGLRGYVRIARLEANADSKGKMLTEAMGIARKPEEKWAALSAWATLKTPASIDALMPHLDDPAVRNEAATAIIAVATELAKGDAGAKAVAAKALQAVVDKCDTSTIQENARKLLAQVAPK